MFLKSGSQMFVTTKFHTTLPIRGNSYWETEILIQNLCSMICASKYQHHTI